MGQGEEVDRHPARAARYPARRVDPPGHCAQDGMAGGVLRMDDPALPVAALTREVEVSLGIAVESDSQVVDQHLLDDARPLAHQLLHGSGIGHVVPRLQDVARQGCRVRARVIDDAPLGPVAVGLQRIGKREELARQPRLGGPERVGRAGQAGPDDEAIRPEDAHRH